MKKLLPILTLSALMSLATFPVWAASKISQSEQSYCMAILNSRERNSRINLRTGPGTNFSQQGYGLNGDRVHILRATPSGNVNNLAFANDSQGFGWYRVGFPKSGAKGWIREDFLSFECFD